LAQWGSTNYGQAYNRRGGAELPTIQIVPIEIERYAAEHTTSLPPLLDELVRETRSRFGSRAEMLCGQVEGQFLQMLVAMSGARRVLEIGTFTGFSALMMAAALPAEAELITLELNAECAEFARGYFARSEHGGKIRLLEGPALDSLRTLVGPFDFVFIDADKASYPAYYKAAVRLLSPGGLIAVDNALFWGQVLDPKDDSTRATAELNDIVTADDRVAHVMLTVRDGIMLVRKK
jgi:caffeoyl-CoA O-methyltransferase